MSAAQLLCQQVGRHLAENPEHPSAAKAEHAKGGLAQSIAQRSFALQLGQLVCIQAPLHGGGKSNHGEDFAGVVARMADLVAALCVAVVDQVARGRIVRCAGFLATQQPQVRRHEVL